MTVTDTQNLLTVEVPSPWTRLRAGHGAVPGVAVETDEHVRLYACGDVSESDAVAQATGQVWLQAMNDVVVVAKRKLLLSSRGSTYVNASRGITVMAGFKPSAVLSELAPGTFPKGVEGYDTSADIVGALSTGFTVALGVGVAAAKLTESVVGSNFTVWQSTSAAINVLGATLNLATLAFKKDIRLPGIQLWSQGGTLIGSTFGSVNVMGVGGVILGAPFFSALALYSTRLRGTKHVSLSSCGVVSLAACYGGVVRSVLSTTLSARTGELVAFGTKRIECGVPNRPERPFVPVVEFKTPTGKALTFPNPQQLTQVITYQALDAIRARSLGPLSMTAVLAVRSTARSTRVEAPTVAIDGGWTLTIDSVGQKIATAPPMPVPGALGLVIDATGVTISGGLGALSAGPTGVVLEGGASSVSIVPGVSLAIDGLELVLG